jgi:hypothetical protein
MDYGTDHERPIQADGREHMTTEAIQILLTLAFGAAFGIIVGFALALMWGKKR